MTLPTLSGEGIKTDGSQWMFRENIKCAAISENGAIHHAPTTDPYTLTSWMISQSGFTALSSQRLKVEWYDLIRWYFEKMSSLTTPDFPGKWSFYHLFHASSSQSINSSQSGG